MSAEPCVWCGCNRYTGSCLCYACQYLFGLYGASARKLEPVQRRKEYSRRKRALARSQAPAALWWRNERPPGADDVTEEERYWAIRRARQGEGIEYTGPRVAPASFDERLVRVPGQGAEAARRAGRADVEGRMMTEEEVLDRIDAWHEGEGGDIDLPEYLGWTPQEYVRYVTTGEIPQRAQA